MCVWKSPKIGLFKNGRHSIVNHASWNTHIISTHPKWLILNSIPAQNEFKEEIFKDMAIDKMREKMDVRCSLNICLTLPWLQQHSSHSRSLSKSWSRTSNTSWSCWWTISLARLNCSTSKTTNLASCFETRVHPPSIIERSPPQPKTGNDVPMESYQTKCSWRGIHCWRICSKWNTSRPFTTSFWLYWSLCSWTPWCTTLSIEAPSIWVFVQS